MHMFHINAIKIINQSFLLILLLLNILILLYLYFHITVRAVPLIYKSKQLIGEIKLPHIFVTAKGTNVNFPSKCTENSSL